MRSKWKVLPVLLVGLFGLLPGGPQDAAWADQAGLVSDTAAVAATASAPVAVAPHGALFRVRFQGHTSYLFGTIHVGKPDFFPLEPQAAQAFDRAGVFMMEVDMREAALLQNAVQKYGLYADNDTLDRHLSPATLARLKRIAA